MRLSLQLYTVREPLQKDLEGTLRSISGMGLQFVELAGLHGKSAAEWRAMLDDLGLKVSGTHDGLDRMENSLDEIIDESRTLGNSFVILPWVAESTYSDGWQSLGGRLEAIARKLAEAEMVFAYHNHAFELNPVDGSTGLDILFESSDPTLVKAQLDLGWVAAGGQDPATYVRRYANRLPLVHLKDFSGDMQKHDAEAGKGQLEWDGILAACVEAHVQFGAIEMDLTPDEPLKSVRRCVEFFQEKGLV
jgi:sugar phosphate isomerase/epimerase